MLNTLRKIVQEVNAAKDLKAALTIIVQRVKETMGSQVCSVYLRRDDQTLELCATQGLRPEAVHTSRLPRGQGLVGRIAETAEPINTPDAAHTHGYRFLPETGEELTLGRFMFRVARADARRVHAFHVGVLADA